jgi:hypothetical protein
MGAPSVRKSLLVGILLLAGCDADVPNPGGGLQSASPPVPALPTANQVPGVAPVVAPALGVLDSPKQVMEKAELARQTGDWTTYVSLLTPETHDNLILQELFSDVTFVYSENSTRERLSDDLKARFPPQRFPFDRWTRRGADRALIEPLLTMPPSPERGAAMRAVIARMPNRQALATELYTAAVLKQGFRPLRPGERPPVEVSGYIANVEIQGDHAYVTTNASVAGSGFQHRTELHLTPAGWKIDLSRVYNPITE